MTKLTIKERPILFSAPMVRAILDGRKTQTRRIVSHVAGLGNVACFGGSETTGYDFALRDRRDMWHEFREDELLACCPYGVPGDRLWVRECFSVASERHAPDSHVWMAYEADGFRIEVDGSEITMRRLRLGKKYPSIHMPRWASRITLEVVDVRVERLQDITEHDAEREGAATCDHFADAKRGHPTQPHKTSFAWVWNKINGRDSWIANPWVWVVEFTRLEEST